MSNYSKSKLQRRIKRMFDKANMNKENAGHTGKEILWDIGAGLAGAQIGKALGGGKSLLAGTLLIAGGEWQNTVDQAEKDYNGDSIMKTLGLGILAGGSLDLINLRSTETKLTDKLRQLPKAVYEDLMQRVKQLRSKDNPTQAEEAPTTTPTAVNGFGSPVDYYRANQYALSQPQSLDELEQMLDRITMNAAAQVPAQSSGMNYPSVNGIDGNDDLPDLM
jgi:hypothetical protein